MWSCNGRDESNGRRASDPGETPPRLLETRKRFPIAGHLGRRLISSHSEVTVSCLSMLAVCLAASST